MLLRHCCWCGRGLTLASRWMRAYRQPTEVLIGFRAFLLPTILVVRVQILPVCLCVCVCIRTVAFERNDIWYLAPWCTLTLFKLTLSSKVKVTGQSSRSQEEIMLKWSVPRRVRAFYFMFGFAELIIMVLLWFDSDTYADEFRAIRRT